MKRKIDLSKYFLPDLNRARKRIEQAKIIKDSFSIPENIKNYTTNKTFHIKTYGCQSNVRDSENMMGILEMIGYQYVQNIKDADLVILNTCAIRENAEKKVLGEIGFLKQFKTNNPNFILGIAGCMAQEEEIVKKILYNYDHVNFIIGTHNIHRLPQIIEQVLLENNNVIEVWSKEGDIIENIPTNRTSKVKAFVNIMFGCDKFCSYCIVPFTRGKIRSRKKEDIMHEVNDLITQGYQEITLLGQNVNSYGIDFKNEQYFFANLLEDIAKTKIARIRFTTSNPWSIDDNLINTIAKYKNIMPHFHLPIQSGDENILAKMNRAMKIENYYKIINKLRTLIPDCAISTDIIVGFPNESDEQFEKTIKLYNDIKFDNAYTFIFSPREGTPAAKMDDCISLETKKARLEQLNTLVKKYSKWNNEKFINHEVEVLVEGPSKNNENIMFGYSPQWKVVNFKGPCQIGDIIKVKITSASRFSLNGEIIK